MDIAILLLICVFVGFEMEKQNKKLDSILNQTRITNDLLRQIFLDTDEDKANRVIDTLYNAKK